MKEKKTEGLKDRESETLPRRTFIKKAVVGVALLPYVVPLIETFTLIDEDAGVAYATSKGGKGGKGGGKTRGRSRGRSKISPTQKSKSQLIKGGKK